MRLKAVFSARIIRLLEQRETEIRDGKLVTFKDVADRLRSIPELDQRLNATNDSKSAAA